VLELPGYRIEAEAGRGGWSAVYRATELASGRLVAIKTIRAEHARDPELRTRFERERHVAATLVHPNVIPVLASGDGYLVMRWTEGRTLSELAPLDPASAARVVAQVAAALDALHAVGFVHRDLKPSNVLVEASGHAYLTDFGLAKPLGPDPGLTAAGRWLGTAAFAAPEQIRGLAADARSDVYALGGVLGFGLTGAVPFPRPTPEATMHAHMYEPVPPLGAHLTAFDPVLQRALAKDPGARYVAAASWGAPRSRRPGRRRGPTARRAGASPPRSSRAWCWQLAGLPSGSRASGVRWTASRPRRSRPAQGPPRARWSSSRWAPTRRTAARPSRTTASRPRSRSAPPCRR
jgi:serine/threonine protein kinase